MLTKTTTPNEFSLPTALLATIQTYTDPAHPDSGYKLCDKLHAIAWVRSWLAASDARLLFINLETLLQEDDAPECDQYALAAWLSETDLPLTSNYEWFDLENPLVINLHVKQYKQQFQARLDASFQEAPSELTINQQIFGEDYDPEIDG
jgi:type II secretory pathway component PulL